MHSVRVALFALVLCLSGCDALNDSPGRVLLRVENRSPVDLTNVLVRFTDTPRNYGAVEAGMFSDYRPFTTAYRYGYIEAQTPDTTYRLQPIDYVGESPLQAGRYTYRLTLEDEQLGLTLVEGGS